MNTTEGVSKVGRGTFNQTREDRDLTTRARTTAAVASKRLDESTIAQQALQEQEDALALQQKRQAHRELARREAALRVPPAPQKVGIDPSLRNTGNTGLTKQDRAVAAVASNRLNECAICFERLWCKKAIQEHGQPTVPHPDGGEMHPMHLRCFAAACKAIGNNTCPICRVPIEIVNLEEAKEEEDQPASLKPQAALPGPPAPRTAWWRVWCCGNETDVLDQHGMAAVEASSRRARGQADQPAPLRVRAALQEAPQRVLGRAEVSVDGKEVVCIFDSEIRNLIERYCIDWEKSWEEAGELRRSIEKAHNEFDLGSVVGLKKLAANSKDPKLCERVLRQQFSQVYDPKVIYLNKQLEDCDKKHEENRGELERAINKRCVYLGLDIREETVWGNLDLSHINVSEVSLEVLRKRCLR